jgi:Zn-finger protein
LLIKNLGASEAMERRRDGNHSLKKIIQYSVENEENGYPVSDPNKTAINDTKEPNGIHKKTLKEEILEETSEKFMEKILDMVNQNVQDALKKFQDTKNKKHKKTQKQINELREDFNKHQSEAKDIRKKDI